MHTTRDEFDDTSWEARTGGSKSLMDLCHEAFSLIFHIHAGKDPGHPEDLKKSLSLLFRDLEKTARHFGYGEEDIKATHYALCALIDETILNSRWAFRDQWADQPLQLAYFNDYMAGERFFELLERVRQKGRRKMDLLEVFCMCLILGFHGKYKAQGEDELAELTRNLMEEVNHQRGGLSSLSSHWKVPQEKIERRANAIPRWAWVSGIAAILIVILIFAVSKLWLASMVEEARRMIQ
jgi:type VI secretion system protein ImpK